ncbi:MULTISPECIES: fimbrial protein [Providencia]|uniref:Fimbrial protein n=2 Tax=Providencia TaxID=586 RepID=A0A1S1HSP9_PROST|nr:MULTISPECIES: fimbrial protein [Providencia]MDV5227654.1 fimbrial protein [Providencia rettgeri]ELR5042166.1 type 1 fimbrial protein [Providencia stuartii]ELR5083539.1 type 1 fimbrial protein [Providencia stuartii]ELR5114576.1 type 1 fimbrial protein [Providencia stuartii]MDX4947368.1 fimbrial protein [Providencia manganoxydans]
MKNLLIIAILFYHIFNMQAFSAVNWGEATVKGEILASGCSMQLTSKNQIIEFGDYPLSRAEEKKITKPFNIILKNCQLSNSYYENEKSPIRVKFSGSVTNNFNGFKFNNADGLSIYILNGKDVVKPNEYYPIYDLKRTSGKTKSINEQQLNFLSEIVVDERLRPQVGEFSSIITFDIDYY